MVRKTTKKAKVMCRRKFAYPSEQAARMAAADLHRADGGHMRVFRCDVGRVGERRHWHIGRARGKRLP